MFPFKKYNKISYEFLSKQPYCWMVPWDSIMVCFWYYSPHPKNSSHTNKTIKVFSGYLSGMGTFILTDMSMQIYSVTNESFLDLTIIWILKGEWNC